MIALSAIALLTLVSYFARQRSWPKAQPPTSKIRLVVLPFDNLSRDAEQEYFSDGMAEELITQLARLSLERLVVVGRVSAMTYKGATKTIDQIGSELNIQYVLEDSVRRAGMRGRLPL